MFNVTSFLLSHAVIDRISSRDDVQSRITHGYADTLTDKPLGLGMSDFSLSSTDDNDRIVCRHRISAWLLRHS